MAIEDIFNKDTDLIFKANEKFSVPEMVDELKNLAQQIDIHGTSCDRKSYEISKYINGISIMPCEGTTVHLVRQAYTEPTAEGYQLYVWEINNKSLVLSDKKPEEGPKRYHEVKLQ
ncbi:MAG: hypothetical protein ABIF40_05955 [archaeon]